jgi:glyoxylase I family protein
MAYSQAGVVATVSMESQLLMELQLKRGPTMFGAVHHISLNCADADRDREFYVSVLGFEEMPRPDLGFKGAWLRIGAQELHLLEVPAFEAPKGQHFAFHVADIDTARTHLMDAGVKVSEPREMTGICRQCFFNDPSGNLLELNQPIAQ